MRHTSLTRAVAPPLLALVLAACGENRLTGPAADAELSSGSLVGDYGVTSLASEFDAAGIGGSEFPESLALTVSQKADIVALQRAFDAKNAADIGALRSAEQRLRTAPTTSDRRRIVEQARPARERVDAAFERLRGDVSGVYTQEQRDWVASQRPPACDPGHGGLTEEQIARIRALHEAFAVAAAPLIELIQQVVAEARAAYEAGASREEIARILAQADEARRELAVLEQRLRQAIAGILNNGQGPRPCRPTPTPVPTTPRG